MSRKRFDGGLTNGLQHGTWTYWHENGRKAFEGKYQLGKREGPWMSWSSGEKPLGGATYKDGVKVEGPLKDGRR
jgi:antitoxin component YwqK of YwqJK toxin-antitoxin module